MYLLLVQNLRADKKNFFLFISRIQLIILALSTTLGHGAEKRCMTEEETRKYHGTGFNDLLESISADQSFSDLDAVGRAHLLGVLQGLELARSLKLAKWDLTAPFYDFEL